jgi:hypothetical protein
MLVIKEIWHNTSFFFFEEDKKNYYQSYLEVLKGLGGGWVMVFNATFNNISVLSWQSVL